MSEQNLEQRVQQLEQRAKWLEDRATAFEKMNITLGRGVLYGVIFDQKTGLLFLDVCDSNRELRRLMIQMHPELETSDIIGQIHAGHTATEFTREKFEKRIAELEATLKSLPPE